MQNKRTELLGIKYYLGLGFLNKMIKEEGKKLNELAVLDDIVLMPKVMYYSRAYACERRREIVNFTQEDIFDYIDEQGGIQGEFYANFSKAYFDAMMGDVPTDEEDKKKAETLK